jgi:hypothetical protein
MAKQGGLVGLEATTDALAGLNYISALVAVSTVATCVNGNKLAKFLTSQNQQKKTQRPNLKPYINARAHHINKQTPNKKKTGKRAKNTTFFQQVLDEQWF